MSEEALWKRRFHAFMAVRLLGLGTFFLGIAIAFTNLLGEGGWPALGAIVAIMGALDAVFAPRMLKKLWEQQDRANR